MLAVKTQLHQALRANPGFADRDQQFTTICAFERVVHWLTLRWTYDEKLLNTTFVEELKRLQSILENFTGRKTAASAHHQVRRENGEFAIVPHEGLHGISFLIGARRFSPRSLAGSVARRFRGRAAGSDRD